MSDEVERVPRLTYVRGLDGLRGLAVAVVLLFHAGHLRGGYLGVDLFFVLSGYLITSLLVLEGSRSGGVGLVRFWGRRARRLLPALGVLVLMVAAYAMWAATDEELGRIRGDGIATLLYVANWREVFADADYWDLFTLPSPFAHTWSLAIEEQFYVVWPLVVVLLLGVIRRSARGPRRLGPWLLGVCVVLGGVALVSQGFWQWRSGWNRVYYGTDTRAFALLCGAALACAVQWRPGPGRWWAEAPGRPGTIRLGLEAVGVVGAGYLAWAFVFMDGDRYLVQHGGLALCSLAGAAVIAAVVHPRRLLLGRVLESAPLVWLGLISYGVYLYHWPIDVWLNADRVGVDGWALFALQLAVTLATAAVSYRFIEQPIRHRTRWTRRTVWTLPPVAFVVLAVLVVFTTTGAVVPSGFDTSSRSLREAAAEARNYKGTTVMMIGNSVASYLADGLEGRTGDDVRIVNNAVVACQLPTATAARTADGEPLDDRFLGECDNGWVPVARAIRADYAVFVRNGVPTTEIPVDGSFVGACSTPFEDRYRDELQDMVDGFADIGVTTVLVTSVPTPQRWNSTEADHRAYLRTVRCGNDVLEELAESNPDDVVLVDLESHLCPRPGECTDEIDDVTLRPDGTHFRDAGARIVGEWILGRAGIDADVS